MTRVTMAARAVNAPTTALNADKGTRGMGGTGNEGGDCVDGNVAGCARAHAVEDKAGCRDVATCVCA